MPLYLTVCSGPRADRASPILAVADQAVIRKFLAEVGPLLGQGSGSDDVSDSGAQLRVLRGPRPDGRGRRDPVPAGGDS